MTATKKRQEKQELSTEQIAQLDLMPITAVAAFVNRHPVVRSLRGKRSNRKGKSGESGQSGIAKQLRESGVHPNAQSGTAQSRGGAEQPDIINTGRIWYEVKRGKTIAPLAALRQADKNSREWQRVNGSEMEMIPVAICTQDHMGTMVSMWLDTYLWLTGLAMAVLEKEAAA